MPRGYHLLVRAGSCAEDLRLLDPSKMEPRHIPSENFTGTVTVRLLDTAGTEGGSSCNSYFTNLPNTTFSLTIDGHFGERVCEGLTGNDLVFGNVFDAPLTLPPGAGLAVRALRWTVDPGLEADLWCPKPWAHSPLLVTMAAIRVQIPKAEEENEEILKETNPIQEDSALILPGSIDGTSASARQRYFTDQTNREAFYFRPAHRYTCDFRNGLVDLKNLAIHIPGWGGVDLLRFWDGRAIRFVLQSRDGKIKMLMVEFQLESEGPEEGKEGEKKEGDK